MANNRAGQRALLLINRHARRGQKELLAAVEQLQKLGLRLLEVPIEADSDLSSLICQHQEQVDLVIIGGGDGTLNAAVEGLVETQLPLGILPLGTANDLARTLNIPPSLPQACEIILTGEVQWIDLGKVNDKFFFNVASLGLSVQITHKLSKTVKQRWGVLAYAVTALQVLWQSRPFWVEIRRGDRSTKVQTIQVAIGNGRYYGGGMIVASDAQIDDQRLDLYCLEMEHWWQVLPLFPALRQGEHLSEEGVIALRGQEFTVTTRHPRLINTDGELTTQTPAHFRVVPQALPVLVPARSPEEPEKLTL